MTSIDVSVPLWTFMLIAIVVGLPLLVILGLAFAAIRRRNWGGLAVLGLLVSGALGMLLFTGLLVRQGARAEAEVKATYARERSLQVAMHAARTAPSPPTAPPAGNFEESLHEAYSTASITPTIDAEVATDEELAAVASAQPKIKLEAVSVPVEVVDVQVNEENATDDATDVKSDRPDWIDAHLGDNQKLITSGPFTTKESCELDTQKQISEWLWSRHEELWPSSAGKFPGFGPDVTQAIKSQHEELRDTSVGEMHILYTLAEVTPEVESQIAKSLAEAAAQVARRRGVRAVSFAGFGVLSLVALTHVVLKSGGRKAKNGAP
jgi:hypothetical protein